MKNVFIILIILITASLAQGNCNEIKNKTIDLVKFGVKVNDEVDDGDSMQKAFDCAAQLYKADIHRRSAVKIVFPEGVIHVNQRLRIDLSTNNIQYPGGWNGGGLVLVGRGMNKSILYTKSSGTLLHIFSRKAQPLITQTIEIRDLTLKTAVANEGAALRIEEEYDQTKERSHQLSINLNMQNVLIDASFSGAYFKYGIHARYLNRPVLKNVKVRNSSSGFDRSKSSCFYFYYSYGVDLNHSECRNAEFGVNMDYVAEGDAVSNSYFSGVKTGIRIFVARDLSEIPGPSGTDGKVTGNKIYYKRHGVYVEGKAWFTIAKNEVVYQKNSTFSGVDIYVLDSKKVSVTMNELRGSGLNRTGIYIRKLSGGVSLLTRIYKNSISDSKYGIQTSSGTDYTIVFNNLFQRVSQKVLFRGSNQQYFD